MNRELVSYGYTEEQIRRRDEHDRQQYETLPWRLPIQCWESYELRVLSEHSQREGIKELAAAEKNAQGGPETEGKR